MNNNIDYYTATSDEINNTATLMVISTMSNQVSFFCVDNLLCGPYKMNFHNDGGGYPAVSTAGGKNLISLLYDVFPCLLRRF